LQNEAKRQGKTQTELVEFALENLRSCERQTTDKLTQIWNDNGRIIAMLGDLLVAANNPNSSKIDALIEGVRLAGIASITASIATESSLQNAKEAKEKANKAMEKALGLATESATNSVKFDPSMMPVCQHEIAYVTGSEEPNAMFGKGDFKRAKALYEYGLAWRNAGHSMPQMPVF
jgi:hypothetical protein